MSAISDLISVLPRLSNESIIALQPFAAFALAAFAIYVVFAVVKEQRK